MNFDPDEFFQAVRENDPLRISLFLHLGVNLNFRDALGKTALHVATEERHLDLVEFLTENGADPNLHDSLGDSCLTLAIRLFGDAEVVGKLIDVGADPNAEDGKGRLPLQLALAYGKTDVARLLVSRGADLFRTSSEGKSVFDMLSDPEWPSGEEILNELLDNVDTKATDELGNTILHRLIDLGAPRRIAHRVLKTGADPNAQNADGNTPLHLALQSTNPVSKSYVPLLLGFGANPYLRNGDGQNAFDILKSAQEFGLYSLLRDYAIRHDLRRKFGVAKRKS